MALKPGSRFGAYEISGEIGAGGMGVVYRAKDTKPDRDVAIKALRESMAADAERLARFDWVDRAGQEQPVAAPSRAYQSRRISPDGTRVALASRDENNDIWLWDLARESLTHLTFDSLLDRFPIKNAWLKRERGIGFEQIVAAIESGGLLNILVHENSERYPGQRVLVISYGNYAYLVPFVEEAEHFCLKTVIPSRKARRDYLTQGDDDGEER